MAGIPGRSGGHNALSPREHVQRGTFRPDRHGPRPAAETPGREQPVITAARRRVMDGLDADGQWLAGRLLDEFDGWHSASLVTMRFYVDAVRRVATATDAAERRREVRTMLALLKALELR
jgi:hypothetical protein